MDDLPICKHSGCAAFVQTADEDYCLVHVEFNISCSRPLICCVPDCVKTCKIRGIQRYCSRHEQQQDRCCQSRCSNTQVEGQYFCNEHFSRITCSINQCISHVGARGMLCLKHDVNPSICCYGDCTDLQEQPSSFCMYHHKLGRFCNSPNCFRRTENKKHSFCLSHLTHPTRCCLPTCRCDVFSLHLCIAHYYISFIESPIEDITQELYNTMMKDPKLFADIDFDGDNPYNGPNDIRFMEPTINFVKPTINFVDGCAEMDI